jgi:hypothetical protein
MLPDCGRSSVRSREDYEPSISGGFWPTAEVDSLVLATFPLATTRGSLSVRIPAFGIHDLWRHCLAPVEIR